MKFTYIIWLMVCMNLSIGLINSVGIYSTDYMTVPENSSYELTDFEGTLAQNPQDSAFMAVTGPLTGFGMLKDLVLGCFYVYEPLVTIWRAPPALAAILQTIVAVSWVLFFIQIITRQSWGGTEG